jgi:hypothetical protein
VKLITRLALGNCLTTGYGKIASKTDHYVIPDSSNYEICFIQEMDTSNDVIECAKLSKTFSITPLKSRKLDEIASQSGQGTAQEVALCCTILNTRKLGMSSHNFLERKDRHL